jgi:hypothetical protein
MSFPGIVSAVALASALAPAFASASGPTPLWTVDTKG